MIQSSYRPSKSVTGVTSLFNSLRRYQGGTLQFIIMYLWIVNNCRENFGNTCISYITVVKHLTPSQEVLVLNPNGASLCPSANALTTKAVVNTQKWWPSDVIEKMLT